MDSEIVIEMSSNRKRAVIFLNGDRSDISRIKEYISGDTLLIGCDGGTNHILALGYKPHVVIGDFDSLSDFPPDVTEDRSPSDQTPIAINGTTYIRYPADKDFTDSELAVQYAMEHGYREIILTATLGSRVDHVLGNILILTKPEFAGLDIKIIESSQEIYLARGSFKVNGRKGDTVSFLPIVGSVRVASTAGLKYELSKYHLALGGNLGISNVLTRKTAEVTMIKGALLVIRHIGQA